MAERHKEYILPITAEKISSVGETVVIKRRGSNRPHKGVDLYAPVGTEVVSVLDGSVIRVVKGDKSSRLSQQKAGPFVDVTTDSFVYRYLHLGSDVRVHTGQAVQQGQVLGTVGPRGSSGIKHARPHLHFEKRAGDYDSSRQKWNAQGKGDYGPPIDPLSFLPPVGKKLALDGVSRDEKRGSSMEWEEIVHKALEIGGPIVGAAAGAVVGAYASPAVGAAVGGVVSGGIAAIDKYAVPPVPSQQGANAPPTPASSLEGQLVQATGGDLHVYHIVNGRKHWVTSEAAMASRYPNSRLVDGRWTGVNYVSPATIAQFPDGPPEGEAPGIVPPGMAPMVSVAAVPPGMVAASMAPMMSVASAPAAKSPDGAAAERLLVARGWSPEEAQRHLNGPTAVLASARAPTSEDHARCVLGTLEYVGWPPEARMAILRGPYAFFEYMRPRQHIPDEGMMKRCQEHDHDCIMRNNLHMTTEPGGYSPSNYHGVEEAHVHRLGVDTEIPMRRSKEE